MSRSTIRSSGDSSPTDSSSTLPTVEATTAPRSETRGAASGSPSRTARLSAAASRTSVFATETRTLTPGALADLRGAAGEVRQLGDQLLHERRDDDRRARPSAGSKRRFSWRTIAISCSSVRG